MSYKNVIVVHNVKNPHVIHTAWLLGLLTVAPPIKSHRKDLVKNKQQAIADDTQRGDHNIWNLKEWGFLIVLRQEVDWNASCIMCFKNSTGGW